MDLVKRIINTFAYIMTGISFSTAIFITVFIPKLKFDISLIWEIVAMSAVCALGNMIYYYKRDLTKKQMKLRIIIHYLYINAVVFGGSFLWEWLTPGLIPEFLVMLLLVTVVYVIITVVTIRQEVKIAENLNRRLRKQYPIKEEVDEL